MLRRVVLRSVFERERRKTQRKNEEGRGGGGGGDGGGGFQYWTGTKEEVGRRMKSYG